ncbi:hypothetical protein QVA66_02090 [Staphylococcus chromogenes]|nr:hypothetical protein [Staphylococcus chromogenes]
MPASTIITSNRVRSSAPTGTLRDLRPVLSTVQRIDALSLSAPSYGSSAANIALSDWLRVGFTGALADQLLTHRDLAKLGVTAYEAWHRAVGNVVDHATDPVTGTAKFRVRPARVLLGQQIQGIQLHSDIAPTSAWLTHPQLFRSVYEYACQRLDTHDIRFFCPESEILFAVPETHKAEALCQVALTWRNSPSALSITPIKYSSGFPAAG